MEREGLLVPKIGDLVTLNMFLCVEKRGESRERSGGCGGYSDIAGEMEDLASLHHRKEERECSGRWCSEGDDGEEEREKGEGFLPEQRWCDWFFTEKMERGCGQR
ncbi:hypothetical protein HAX54_019094 [Datura stramonium]|uniref:Uncharacterized protein n=1 Tax=Datura stramonium TaxID=4076 RepID=A0ABS8S1M1_DATST|nr:hypothetical protein [Datura stramonium]